MVKYKGPEKCLKLVVAIVVIPGKVAGKNLEACLHELRPDGSCPNEEKHV